MIYNVTSDLASFKSLKLRSGLNVLLADKSVGATDRQTRNGAGKTSLIELIHFVLGANAEKSTSSDRQHWSRGLLMLISMSAMPA